MSNFCILVIDIYSNALEGNPRLKVAYEDSFNKVVKTAMSIVPNVFIYSANGRSDSIFKNTASLSEIAGDLKKWDNIVVMHSNMPLISPTFSKELIERHLEYNADFTFYEFLPRGLMPFVITNSCLTQVTKELIENDEVYTQNSIQNHIASNMNDYDIEILTPPYDLRFVMDDLTLKDQRSFTLINNISHSIADTYNLHDAILKNPAMLRSLPTMVNLSLSYKQTQYTLFHAPLPTTPTNACLPLDLIKHLLDEFTGLGHYPTISLPSHLGEPLLYPFIGELLELIEEYPSFQFMMETDGINLGDWVDTIAKIPNLTTVIHLSAFSSECYKTVHGTAHLEIVLQNIEKMLHANLGNTYIQWTRMKDNEDELESFMKRWKSCQNQIIIQTHNSFAGELPVRKAIDLTPLKRFPCFALGREIHISPNSTLHLCLQDIAKTPVFAETISTTSPILAIAQKLDEFYNLHRNFESLPAICQKCDYWYIFNF